LHRVEYIVNTLSIYTNDLQLEQWYNIISSGKRTITQSKITIPNTEKEDMYTSSTFIYLMF